ncbi:uncharacterized protein LOC131298277 isoform X2 [Rhododendron vialii]|uniref:uncharacterized protein LOC131298277 isoform X2 n=1 Tax=Rhododendron vialii TaxID=182163 RepID=UPI00266053A4|nr:uncharacterized protein LOC131298277 isoform X2 [Rhododendron vialii]
MAVSLTRFSWWLWSGKGKEPLSNGSSLNPSSDRGKGMREVDNVKFPSVKGAMIAAPRTRKVGRKWQSREERRIKSIDKDYDAVLVPSDGVCLSGSESDDSDWSIGWLEPHAPDFQSDDEGDDSFAVLVPCYRHDCKELEEGPSSHFLSAMKNLSNEYGGQRFANLVEFCMLWLHLQMASMWSSG